MSDHDFHEALDDVVAVVKSRYDALDALDILPTHRQIIQSIAAIPDQLPTSGRGTKATMDLLIKSILPGILQGQPGPRYFGFVVGGVTPAAQLADILVTSYDENVQVSLPEATASTTLERRALEFVLDLVGIPRDTFAGQTVTTGATASNVLGLACAREWLCAQRTPRHSWALSGPPTDTQLAPIAIVAIQPHFSISKAAALVGIGCGSGVIYQAMPSRTHPCEFDLLALEQLLNDLATQGRGAILSYGFGEVNTGCLGADLDAVAELCGRFNAWLHIDAAFGGFATLLPEYSHLARSLSRANSLTLDGHKWLNLPYDCGLFYTRRAEDQMAIFMPDRLGEPAYLSARATMLPGSVEAPIPSPLYLGVENSRRFRALPLLASLLSLGHDGYTEIVVRNVMLARGIAQGLSDTGMFDIHNRHLTAHVASVPLNIVLFSARTESALKDGRSLAAAINRTNTIYVTATVFSGESAVRLAVSNWRSGTSLDQEIAFAVRSISDALLV